MNELERAELALAQVVAERDEARHRIDALRAEVEQWREQAQAEMFAKREARAEVERLQQRSGYVAGYDEARAAVVREVEPLRAALAELVRLKDGPRDDAYREAKDGAWEAARVALQRFGSDARPEGGAAPGTPERFVEILRDVQARDARPSGGGSQ